MQSMCWRTVQIGPLSWHRPVGMLAGAYQDRALGIVSQTCSLADAAAARSYTHFVPAAGVPALLLCVV